jgi:hexosaminidase
MKKILVISMLFFSFVSCINHRSAEPNIIPKPQKIQMQDGNFFFSNHVNIRYVVSDSILSPAIGIFQHLFNEKANFRLKVNDPKEAKKTIWINIDQKLAVEAYSLQIFPDSMVLIAADRAGVFYGLMSLYQSIEKQGKHITAPCMSIHDEPAFRWRGMHLDVSRHFYTVDEIKKLLNAMSLLKLNRFHWHLTDDQGWRIEIKKYPRLTEVGSSRSETLEGHAAKWPETYDGKEVKGFYTQEQIKEVVAYAQARQIMVVPEIEMPGHAIAALAAYPQYACTKGPFKVWGKWGVNPEVFCAGNEKTYDFLEDILDEVCELFPGKYIHIGGDECPKIRWEHCSKCQKKMADEQLKNTDELQAYFTNRIEKYLNSKGKTAVGWDEILDGGAPSRALIMSWRGEEGGIAAANAGNDVVMTPNASVYFDHYQDRLYEPLAIAGLTDLSEVYYYQPIPKNMKTGREHVLGAQAQLWTEYIVGNKQLEYMIFPRLIALAEVLWTAEDARNYADFQKRLSYWYLNLDRMDINYRIDYPHGYNQVNSTLGHSFDVELSSDNSKAKIYYTINGFDPDDQSLQYTESIHLKMPEDSVLKSIAILPNGKRSHIHSGVFKHVDLQKDTLLVGLQAGLNYSLFQAEFSSAKDVSQAKPIKQAVVQTIEIPDTLSNHEFFGLSYSGFIKVPENDLYNFYLTSDDGAILSIDGEQIVNNDGFHYDSEKMGQIALKAGYHAIKMEYFQGQYGVLLNLQLSNSQRAKQEIPSSWLWHVVPHDL